MRKIKNKAFTLAEVLITLGIVGVVAAMTLPSLIQSTKRYETSAKLKKFYSSFSQAIIRSEVDNDSSLYWERSHMVKNQDGNYDYIANEEILYNFFMKYISPYLVYTDVQRGDNDNDFTVYLSDGTTMTLSNGGCIDIIFDANGAKKPNYEGKDQFRFLYCNDPYNTIYYMSKDQTFGTYLPNIPTLPTRETGLNLCKTNHEYCSTFLQKYDNFEFKNDYPLRL